MINPIFLKETNYFNLRQEGVVVRFIFPLILYGLFMFIFAIAALTPGFNATSLGFYSFVILSWLTFILGILLALGLTSRAISQEKENGTLETLLLTPLSSRGLIGGKLAAALWNTANLLSVTLPLAGVLIGLASLNPARYLLVFILISFTIIGISSLGLLMSCIVKKSASAYLIGLFSLLGLGVITLPVIFMPTKNVPDMVRIISDYFLYTLNPFYNLNQLLFSASPYYLPSVLYSMTITIFSLFAVNMSANTIEKQRVLKQKKIKILPERIKEAIGNKVDTDREATFLKYEYKKGQNPIQWLTLRTSGLLSRYYMLPRKKYILLLLVSFIIGCVIAFIPFGNYLIYLLLIYQISANLIGERESGFYQSFLSTPFPETKLISGKLWGFFKISLPIMIMQIGTPLLRAIIAATLMTKLNLLEISVLCLPIFILGCIDVLVYSIFLLLVSLYVSSKARDVFQSSLIIFLVIFLMGAFSLGVCYFGAFIALIPIAFISTMSKSTFSIAAALTFGGVTLFYVTPILIYLPSIFIVYQLIKGSFKRRLIMAN